MTLLERVERLECELGITDKPKTANHVTVVAKGADAKEVIRLINSHEKQMKRKRKNIFAGDTLKYPLFHRISGGFVFCLSELEFIDADGYHIIKRYTPKPISDEEFENAKKYTAHLIKRTTINKKLNSYTIKHEAEAYLRHLNNGQYGGYISNGALIVAMIEAGFKHEYQELHHLPTKNMNFNVTKKSIRFWEV